jgi:hypothetical protein
MVAPASVTKYTKSGDALDISEFLLSVALPVDEAESGRTRTVLAVASPFDHFATFVGVPTNS